MNRRSVFILAAFILLVLASLNFLILASSITFIKQYQIIAEKDTKCDKQNHTIAGKNTNFAEVGLNVSVVSIDVDKKIYEKIPENRSIVRSASSDTASSSINALTRSAIIRIENNITLHSEEKVFSHFFVHIPKAGGESTIQVLTALLKSSNKFQVTEKEYQYRLCNEGTNFFEDFKDSYGGVKCNLWISEQPYDSRADHVYTITRNPLEHVLSMYFHCTESWNHEKLAHLMPSLDKWLDHHVERLETGVQQPKLARQRQKQPPFMCYDPINFQSFFTGFNSTMTEEELYNKYDVIGDMDYFRKSQCAIFIRYTGYIPPSCVCDASTTSRKLLQDHGVVHHGATFNTTDKQVAKIMKLTAIDQILHERVKRVFSRQVKDIEEELGITLCD